MRKKHSNPSHTIRGWNVSISRVALRLTKMCIIFIMLLMLAHSWGARSAYAVQAPLSVVASDGEYPDSIHITWSPVPGAQYYQVYRNSIGDSNTATAIGNWQPGTSYDDLSVIPGQGYYYWVKAAVDRSGTDRSDLSLSDSGYAEVTEYVCNSIWEAPSDAPEGLTNDGAYIWHIGHKDWMLYKLDPTDGTVLEKIPHDANHDPYGTRGLAWDGQYFWISTQKGETGGQWVYPVGLDGKRVEESRLRGWSTTWGLTYLDDMLWASTYGGQKLYNWPATGGNEWFASPGSVPQGLANHGGYLWNVDSQSDKLYQVDPVNGEVLNTFQLPPAVTEPRGLTWFKGCFYVSNVEDHKIYAFQARLNAPENIFASDGEFPGNVQVSWDLVPGATHYRIYRNDSNAPDSAIPVTGWQTETIYHDTETVSEQVYYYWARSATNSSGANASLWSTPDTGFAKALQQDQLQVEHTGEMMAGVNLLSVVVNQPEAFVAIYNGDPQHGEILGQALVDAGIRAPILLSRSVTADDDIRVIVTKQGFEEYRGRVSVTDPCAANDVIRSTGNGNWLSNDTWTPHFPTREDIVFINAGDTITVIGPKSPPPVKGICNAGTLISSSSVANFVLQADDFIHNRESGRIISANGEDGGCPAAADKTSQYIHATPGRDISLQAATVINQGEILSGRGGDDATWACLTDESTGRWAWQHQHSNFGAWQQQIQHDETQWGFPTVGGGGGKITIIDAVDVFINTGLIRTGAGGNADSMGDDHGVHGLSRGGTGGAITINAQNLVDSISTGTLQAGCGGPADVDGCWTTGDVFCNANTEHPSGPGKGGHITFNAGNGMGTFLGCVGSITRWDPTTLKASNTTRFEGSDVVEIFGGNEWGLDLRGLVAGAVSANNTITIAVAQGGSVDLRGVTGKVFTAGRRVEIFADDLLLDEGRTFEDLAEAPEVIVKPGKSLYRVSLSSVQHVIGSPGENVKIPLQLLNSGPATDTYTVSMSNPDAWNISGLPTHVSVESLQNRVLHLEVTLPDVSDETYVTVTATSQADPTILATSEIRITARASVNPIEQGLHIIKKSVNGGRGRILAGDEECDLACTTLTVPYSTATTLVLKAIAASDSYFVRWEDEHGAPLEVNGAFQVHSGDTVVAVFGKQE